MNSDKPNDDDLPAHADGGDDDHAVQDVSGLTPRQEQAIIALLREPTLAQAARSVDISERTLHRWLNKLTFRDAYRKARREVYNQALALIHKYSPLAVNTLARTLSDPMVQASVKVAAAVAIIKLGRDALELDDLQERVANLEKSMGAEGNPTKRVYTVEFDEGPLPPGRQSAKEHQ